MPELPEVQTVIDNLKPILLGKIIKSITIPNSYVKVLQNGSYTDYEKFLINKKIKSLSRRGKYIIINLDKGHLLIHLRMTGTLLTNKPNQQQMKYVSFQLKFIDGLYLFFKDIRKFGRIYICENLDWLENKLGLEPLSSDFNSNWLYNKLHQYNRMIKPLLLDQKFIAGLGNIYVDEALWDSGIHPKLKSKYISKNRSNKLLNSIQEILKRAISYQGTTIINFSYGQNKNGNFADELQIFGKLNSPCPKCKYPIIKKFIAQRGTHYCKRCQKY